MEHEIDTRTPLDRISPEQREAVMQEQELAAGRGYNPSVVDSLPLAMAYVPRQKWRSIYSPDDALLRGTMFAELDKPFYQSRVCGNGTGNGTWSNTGGCTGNCNGNCSERSGGR